MGGAYFDMKESNALLNLGSVSSTPGQPFAFKALGAIRESIWDLSICLKSGSTLLDLCEWQEDELFEDSLEDSFEESFEESLCSEESLCTEELEASDEDSTGVTGFVILALAC